MLEAAQQESLENVKFNIHRTNVCAAAAALDAFSWNNKRMRQFSTLQVYFIVYPVPMDFFKGVKKAKKWIAEWEKPDEEPLVP